MKRIVFTVSNDLSFDQRMIRICTALSEAGYDVIIIGFRKKDSPEIPDRPYKQIRLPLWLERGKLFYLEICIRLFFKLLFTKSGIICAVDMDTLFPARLSAFLKSAKLVFDAHEYFSETSGLVGRPFEKGIWKSMERILIPGLKYAYTVNGSLATLFRQHFGTEFSVIMNLPEKAGKLPEEKSDYYLYQGVLNKGRGLEELIDLFAKNKLKLKIAGEGPLKQKLQQRIIDLNARENIDLLGFVPPDKLRELTGRAYAGFNLVDGSGKSYYYSLANKFFDYMHAEIPQICMDFPEYKKINDQYKVAILIADFTELKKAVEQLESDKNLYRELVKNSRLAKEKYNWETEKKKLIDFYSDLSSSR